MTTKVAREQIFKKPKLLHIKLTGLSDETLGSKIRRAIFRISSVPVKKSHLSQTSADSTVHVQSKVNVENKSSTVYLFESSS